MPPRKHSREIYGGTFSSRGLVRMLAREEPVAGQHKALLQIERQWTYEGVPLSLALSRRLHSKA